MFHQRVDVSYYRFHMVHQIHLHSHPERHTHSLKVYSGHWCTETVPGCRSSGHRSLDLHHCHQSSQSLHHSARKLGYTFCFYTGTGLSHIGDHLQEHQTEKSTSFDCLNRAEVFKC